MHNRFWFLLSKKLSSNATDAELSELDSLVAEHAEWQFAVQQLLGIWERNKVVPASEKDFADHIARMKEKGFDTTIFHEEEALVLAPLYGAPRRRWVTPAIAASTFFAIALSWFIYSSLSHKNSSLINGLVVNKVGKTISTKRGYRSRVILPDGTQVWLNAESKLEYTREFGKTNRDVKLSGEAYFDVVKNENMPFTIQTNRIRIKVTGTAFNVKAYPNEKLSETSLIRGRVEVTVNARPDEKYILKPNEKLVVRDEVELQPPGKDARLPVSRKMVNEPLIQLGYLNYVGNDSAAIETAWVYNKLIFDNESLTDIARKMERWYGIRIEIKDDAIAAQRLTYTIKNETAIQALGNMQYVMQFHYSVNENNVTITK